MKIRNIAVGVVVGGVAFAGGVAVVAWQKGLKSLKLKENFVLQQLGILQKLQEIALKEYILIYPCYFLNSE